MKDFSDSLEACVCVCVCKYNDYIFCIDAKLRLFCQYLCRSPGVHNDVATYF